MTAVKYLPNLITMLRIAGACFLLFVKPLSHPFYALYTLCGLSDVLDGAIARAAKLTSEFGAKLDSIADLLFYAVMLLRIFPVLWRLLPKWIWCLAAAVLALRLVCYTTAAVKYRRFAALHTYMNKLSGLAVFSVPYLILLPWADPLCVAVCVITALASCEELVIHLRAGKYDPSRKTLMKK